MRAGHKKPFVWIIFLHTYNTYRGYIKEALSFFSFAVVEPAFGSHRPEHQIALMMMPPWPRNRGRQYDTDEHEYKQSGFKAQ